jgi:hypothetical protein
MSDTDERSVASAGFASADGPTRAEIFAALDTLTRAIGCYGERIAHPFVIRWGNGLIAGINGEFEAGGLDNVTSRISRLQGRDWRTL